MISISNMVGPLDWPSAAAICTMAGMAGLVAVSLIVKRRSRLEIDNEFELAKIKEANSQELQLSREAGARKMEEKRIESEHQLESERIGQNLITSHARTVKGNNGDG